MSDFVYVLMLIGGMAFLVSSGVFAVCLYRGDASKTPVGDYPSPRSESPAGPKQPEGSRPPTGTFRPQHRVAPSDPSLSAALSPGWRFR